ncbi:MAG: hypothetical protein GYA73_05015, partial [Planctomycetes bacterium]|nr:hypothetical protein [Planctomycetota bacterium]
MSGSPLLMFEHGGLAELGRVPELAVAEFRAHVLDAVSGGARIATFFGRPAPGGAVRLLIVLSEEYTGILSAAATTVYDSYTALTPECPQAHWFEREIAEQWGVVPRGHPWLKPIRFHPSYRDGKDAWHRAEAPAAGGTPSEASAFNSSVGSGGFSMTIPKNMIRPGQTLVLESVWPDSQSWMVKAAIADGPVGACQLVDADPMFMPPAGP